MHLFTVVSSFKHSQELLSGLNPIHFPQCEGQSRDSATQSDSKMSVTFCSIAVEGSLTAPH